MKVLITGGGGFLGLRLARTLLERGALTGRDGKAAPITQIKLLDTTFPPDTDPRLQRVQGDLADPATIAGALEPDTASVFHLAAVVSAGAEADFELGMRVNLDGTRALLEAIRRLVRPPRLVFASSVAAFGGELPATLDDSTTPKPQTSYGTQKVIGEYLVSEYARRGFVDGRCLRLPTIVVRPGKPNLAASSFASAIFREPLAGQVYECPLPDSTGIWLLSPRKVTEAFVHAHELAESAWGSDRVVNLPGITVTIRQGVAELGRIAGPAVAERVRFKIDARIKAIVDTWPVRFRTPRALAMGFSADPDIESVIRDHIREQKIAV